ncbi:cobalamin-binding protein [Pedobacter sp. SYSU D00535]|uniref:cobalamin-binding protein n=1 Tax=Pedobacter sp. SYSU D00535 TaxID=2810308 RepID=UPI001A95E922|nr:cobalamin-binding protein [Pedobacter sp. SYSU D00535]
MSDKKIISLLPAATEIVCALGLEHQLVGRSHECDYPESVQHLPVCSSARFEPGSSSLEIDNMVKASLTEALSIYTVNKNRIAELKPDVVITQAQCEVCAVSLSDVESALRNLLDKEANVISLNPNTLQDIFNEIALISKALGVPEKGEALLEDLQERITLIQHKLKFVEARPKVACIEWLNPLMIAGNWTPELVEIAGGIPVLAQNGKHSPYIKPEELLAANPEVIIVAACGFSVERTLQEVNLLFEIPGWQDLEAVKNNRFYIADGNHYFNRSGPRIVDTVEMLAEIIQPKQFIFGYEGNSWLKFSL